MPSFRDLDTMRWLSKFIPSCKLLYVNSKAASRTCPVKVAIFDTGIDATNGFIKTRWPINLTAAENQSLKAMNDEVEREKFWEVKEPLRREEFPTFYYDLLDNPSAPEDNDGHGTHIAGLILRFAPNAHLYVYRIGNTRKTINGDAKFADRVAAVSTFL